MDQQKNEAEKTPGRSIPIHLPAESLAQMVREGWASIEEQQEYWRRKEREAMNTKHLMAGMDIFADFLSDLQIVMAKCKVRMEKLVKETQQGPHKCNASSVEQT